MTNWQITKLKDVCERVTVGFVGSMAHEYRDSGVPFLRSQNITPFRLSLDRLKYIDEKFHEKIRKSALRPGDVAVVRTGHPGIACVIPRNLKVSNCSDLVIIRPGKQLNPYFLCSVFNSAFGRDLVGGNLVGAAQQHFNITVAKELKLLLPSRVVQNKIAAILSTYDDLIENNRRRIALLEKMAEEIYREWFVRMRFPRHEQAKFEKGVPEGWRKAKLPDVAKITYGFPFQGDRFNTVGIGKPIIRIRNIPDASTDDFTDEVADEKYIVRKGDLLVGMDGEFHINHWQGDDAYLVQRTCRIKAIDAVLEGYLAWVIRAPIKHYESILLGATVGHLGAKHLNSIDVLIPPDSLSRGLRMLNDLLNQKIALSSQSRKLKEMRNALLPRLISSKLSVEFLDIRFPPSMQDDAAPLSAPNRRTRKAEAAA